MSDTTHEDDYDKKKMNDNNPPVDEDVEKLEHTTADENVQLCKTLCFTNS